VLVATAEEGNVDLRLRVEGDRATLRYVPPTAARGFRVGGVVWRGIGAGDRRDLGRLEALAGGRSYASAQYDLIGDDHLRLVVGADGAVEIWARPGAGALPVADEVDQEAACVATSLRHDQTDVPWAWGITAPPPANELRASAMLAWPQGRRERYEMAAALPRYRGVSPRYDMVVDVERSRVPDVDDHHAYIWRPRAGEGRLWEDQLDLTASELEALTGSYRDQGFRPTDLEGYSTPAGVRYAGLWVQNSEDIDWLSSFDLTSGEYGTVYQERREAGYRLVDVEAYATPGGTRFAGIWYKSCDNTNWRQWRNLTREQYQARVDSLTALDFRVVDFESYRTSAGQRYAAIWEKIPSPRAWRVRTDRTLKEFLNYHHRYLDEGFRLVDYESYDTDGGIRYGGVWAEDAPRFRYAARATLNDSIAAYLAANDLPGISVVIIQDGDVVYQRGFGFADRERDKWAHARTVYLTASVSKAIGATLAARLEARGVGGLDLSKKTSEYLGPAVDYLDVDDAAAATCSLVPSMWFCNGLPGHHGHTVEQLLSKTGCVPHYREGREPDQSEHYHWRAQALAQIWSDSLLADCTPGQQYRYSTHGFTYVGAVLEAVTGISIARLVQDEIARPFDFPSMRAMYTGDGNHGYLSDYDRARAYSLTNTSNTKPPAGPGNPSIPVDYSPNASWKVLGGGIEAHALDLARFGWKLLDGDIVSATVRDGRLWTSLTGSAMAWADSTTQPPTIPTDAVVPSGGVGLAWVLGGTMGAGNGRWARHGGNAIGAGSQMTIWRDQGVVIAMLSNRTDHVRRNALLNRLARVVFAATPP
jgi:CubicO group peptidase (beta-lactamase class C family)